MRCVKHVKNCALQNVFKIYTTGGRNARNKYIKFKK